MISARTTAAAMMSNLFVSTIVLPHPLGGLGQAKPSGGEAHHDGDARRGAQSHFGPLPCWRWVAVVTCREILARYLARREECYCPLAALSGPTRWALLRSATDPNRTLAERFHEKLRRKTNAHFLFAQCNKLDPKLLRRERLCGMAFLQGALVTVSCYLPPARAIDLT